MAYYGKTIPSQMQGKYTRPAAGLNKYTPSHEINDNLLSDCLDALPYKETGIQLFANPATTAPLTVAQAQSLGQAHISIADESSGSDVIVSLTENGVVGSIIVTDSVLGTQTQLDITAMGVPADLTGFDTYSVCRYATEAANYVVFACDAIKKLIWYDYATVGSVTIPFYPTKIVSHANRIFALDDKNTLWWSRAGAPFNIAPMTDSWYSAITESQVLEDAGYWVVERERRLEEMCVLNEALYLFGRQNIYIFQGTNYDTFQLSMLISDFGIKGDMFVKHLALSNNACYVVDDGNVYEFDGQGRPRLISHPIFVNTGLTNGVLGGIPQIEFSHLTADRNRLYYYQKWHCPLTEDVINYEYLYIFDFKTRTWWKTSGLNNATTTLSTSFHVQLVPSYDMSKVYAVVSDWTAVRYWYLYSVFGTANTDSPYIISKAFNTMPSTQETLTAIILQLQGVVDTASDLKLYYSLTTDTDDFVEFWYNEDYIFSGDLENIYIPVPVSIIANSHHYRIMFESAGSSVVVYNIERRFRTRGLSR